MRKRPVFKVVKIHNRLSEMEYPTPSRTVNIGTRKHRKEVLMLYCGYDTETTTIRTIEGWRSAVYSHQISIANDSECHILLLRSWDDFIAALYSIKSHYGISEDKRIIFWVANLSFEFSFMAYRFSWGDFFAKDIRQPLLATALGGVEFRECLTITGGSLAHLANTYCYTKKLVGDLDYSILRNSSTALTTEERAYIVNDVLILSEFSHYVFKHHIIPRHKVPMTKTSILLDEVKSEYLKMSKSLDTINAHKQAYDLLINKCYPTHDFYNVLFRYVFRGGYVHANALYAGITLDKVDMYDITSSYPYEMLTSYVPVTPFRKEPFNAGLLKSHCCIMFAEFKNIRQKTRHTIESKNKIIDHCNARFDNGRLVSASSIKVALTELDYANYSDFYMWDSMEVFSFYIAKRGKMPKFLRQVLVRHYALKNTLKKQGKQDTIEYKLAKEAVNSLYGACVKRIRLDKIDFDSSQGWITVKNDKPYDKEIANKILLPQWGVWVTASARKSLLSAVKRLDERGVKVVYCDTDSIKYISNPLAPKIINAINNKRTKHLHNRGYKMGALKGLGEFVKENKDPVKFKTCGAKRYIYSENGKVSATIAGMPKRALNGYSEIRLFEIFTEYGFCLPAENSLKLTTAYTDTPYSIYVDGEWMNELSGVALYDIPFTMRLDDEYVNLIHSLKEEERIGYAL